MFKDKSVLVTGGAGFIGTNLIQRLLARGAKVRATLHQRPAQIDDPRVEWIPTDLTDGAACHRVAAGIDYVFLCAANTSGAAVMTANPLAHVTPNVLMNAQMLEAAYQARVQKLLFISSSAAYPESGDRPVREEEMFLGDPPAVYYAVGWMKRYTEILCQTYATKIKNPMPIVVIRPSNLFGPFDKFDFGRSHVTAASLRKVVERHHPIEVWGTGEDVRDLIYVNDFITALLSAMETSEAFAVYNIGAGQGFTVNQVLRLLLELDGYPEAPVVHNAAKPSTIPIRLLDVSRAEARLGFKASTDLRTGLSRTLDWYRQNLASPAAHE
jgi:GDP-L-fucose synthase